MRNATPGTVDFSDVVMTSMAEGLYALNSDGLVSYVNPAAETLLGWPKEDLIGRSMHEIIHYKHRDGTPFPVQECAGLEVLKKGRSLTGQEDAFIRKDGTFFDVVYSSSPIMAGEQIAGLVVVFRDVSDQLQASQALRRNEQDLTDFFETAAIGLHWVGPDGLILRANQAELDLLGYRREEYVGRHIADFHEDRAVIKDILARLAKDEKLKDYPARLRCKDGSVKHVLISSSVLWEDGRFIHTRCFTRDVTDQYDRKGLERSQAVLAAIIESSEDAIVSKSLDGTITSWNASAERLFGYTANEAIGKPVTFLMPPDRVNEERDILARLKAGKRIEPFETVRRRKDGTHLNVSLSISPIKDATGRIVGAAKIVRDITAWKQIEAERESLLARERTARAEAEQANQVKEEFLATLSHELRTPIAGILGWAQVLVSGVDQAGARRAALAIERGAKTQAQLINSLLDVSSMVMGKFAINVQIVDFSLIVEAAMDIVRLMAETKQIALTFISTAPKGSFIKGDPDRLQQAVWNVLTNAIKFTPKGGRIAVQLEGEADRLRLLVRDTGQGIKPSYLPFVFHRFSQGDPALTRHHGGLGLGLSVVKGVIEMHGGEVRADSPGEGQGTTLSIDLPTVQIPDNYVAERSSAEPSHAKQMLKGVRVLIVDDDRDVLDLLAVMLAREGVDVRTRSTAREAVDLVQTWRPHLLLCDISMPGEDGYALIRKIRGSTVEQGGQIPAVAVTAFARPEDRERALRAGYQGHVSKPFEIKDVLTVVAQFADPAHDQQTARTLKNGA